MERSHPVHVSVVGAGDAGPEVYELARAVGRELAAHGCVVLCGGLGGVMEGACRGAREAGGRTVAILPGSDPAGANPWAEIVIPTGMGHARNVIVVQSGDVVIALPGSRGTQSEVALALKTGRPIVGLGAWAEEEGVVEAGSPREAVVRALALSGRWREK